MSLVNGFSGAQMGGPGLGQAFGLGGGDPMSINNGMMALGQQQQMFSACMNQMMTMMGMLMNLMMMGQMQAMASSANFGAGGGTPSMGNAAQGFLGAGGGGSAPSSGGGSTPSAGGGSGTPGAATGNLVERPGGKIDASIAGNFDAMVAAAKKDGVSLQINSGHRSRAEQEKLYAAYKNGTGNLAAKPGTSNHEKGQAIDFKNNAGAYSWLAKNAERFGFKNLPGEPWHYSPTGT